MRYCDKCKVSVGGSGRRCPLCQGLLSGEADADGDLFPSLQSQTHQLRMAIRMLVFASITAVVVCFAINALIPFGRRWPLFVAAGVVCMWICLYNVLLRLRNIPKNIMWMVFWLSLLAVVWDAFTGRYGWSLDYVIPSISLFAMVAMAVIARALHLRIEDYLIYLMLDGLFGVIPLLFLLLGWVRVAYPSIICVAASAISMAALFSFEGERLVAELKKRLHL